MATTHDRTIVRLGLRFALSLKKRLATHGYPISDSPLVPDGGENASDEDVDKYVREQTKTALHYSSTCRMVPEFFGAGNGGDDGYVGEDGGGVPGGVVDSRLRVYGVKGLRVADASVMPHVLSAHLVASTVAIAEKCADLVKEDWSEKSREG